MRSRSSSTGAQRGGTQWWSYALFDEALRRVNRCWDNVELVLKVGYAVDNDDEDLD